MRSLHFFLLSMGLLLSAVHPAVGFAARDCSHVLAPSLTREQIISRRFAADPSDSKIQRRIKILTNGEHHPPMPEGMNLDSPDPSLVMRIKYPDGSVRYRISFTGMTFIESEDARQFFRGGIFVIKRATGFYPDGTEMQPPDWPWDVVTYLNDEGQLIAYGGAMEQPERGMRLSMVHNHTRSRWWGEVKHVETEPGIFAEQIYWKAPLHDFNQKPRANLWENHGYGGTLLTKFNPRTGIHEKVKLANGNYLLFYERVTEEKLDCTGCRQPWVTTMFVREVDPSLKRAVGEEVMVTDLISPRSNDYYRATHRPRPEGLAGYLAEGGNVLFELKKKTLIKAWSASDFWGRYGIYLDYLPRGAPFKSMFLPVTDPDGELTDFAEKLRLREIMNGTWIGRPQLEYDPDGKLWLRFHYVPLEGIPEGMSHDLLPAAEAERFFPRFAAQIPVRVTYDRQGRPNLTWDLDPEFSDDLLSYEIETEK